MLPALDRQLVLTEDTLLAGLGWKLMVLETGSALKRTHSPALGLTRLPGFASY